MKQTKKKVENKKCFCGEIDIILELKNSEIEINGIRHSIYGCYCVKQTKKKECEGIVSCAVNCGGVMCKNKPRKTDINKPKEQIFEECIARYKTLEVRVSILENKPCKIEINKSKKRKINPTKGIDENLKCSHCGNKVIECMGKCETTLFKGKEVKEKNESFIKRLLNNIKALKP